MKLIEKLANDFWLNQTYDPMVMDDCVRDAYMAGFRAARQAAGDVAQYNIRLRFSGQYSELVAQEVGDKLRTLGEDDV